MFIFRNLSFYIILLIIFPVITPKQSLGNGRVALRRLGQIARPASRYLLSATALAPIISISAPHRLYNSSSKFYPSGAEGENPIYNAVREEERQWSDLAGYSIYYLRGKRWSYLIGGKWDELLRIYNDKNPKSKFDSPLLTLAPDGEFNKETLVEEIIREAFQPSLHREGYKIYPRASHDYYQFNRFQAELIEFLVNSKNLDLTKNVPHMGLPIIAAYQNKLDPVVIEKLLILYREKNISLSLETRLMLLDLSLRYDFSGRWFRVGAAKNFQNLLKKYGYEI